jgi:hypothetical protein
VLHAGRVAQDLHPGVSVGVMDIDAGCVGWASGLVTAITIRKSEIDTFEENHLRLSTCSSQRSATVGLSGRSGKRETPLEDEQSLDYLEQHDVACQHCSTSDGNRLGRRDSGGVDVKHSYRRDSQVLNSHEQGDR